MDATQKRIAAIIAVVSTLLILGALAFQAMGYAPCEMCMWQRWGHVAAAFLGALAIPVRGRKGLVLIAGAIVGMATSGAIGVFHAGVEWKLWEGITTCAARFTTGHGDVLTEIMKAPLVRCDEAAWRLLGISMAGYNAIISLGTAVTAMALLARLRPTSNDS